MKNIVSTLFLFILCGSLFVGCKIKQKSLHSTALKLQMKWLLLLPLKNTTMKNSI